MLKNITEIYIWNLLLVFAAATVAPSTVTFSSFSYYFIKEKCQYISFVTCIDKIKVKTLFLLYGMFWCPLGLLSRWIVFLSQACIDNWEAFTSPPCPTQSPPLEKEKGSISVVVIFFAWKTWWWAIGCQFRCLLISVLFLCEAYATQEEGSRQEPSLPSFSMCSTGWVSSKLAFFWASDSFS